MVIIAELFGHIWGHYPLHHGKIVLNMMALDLTFTFHKKQKAVFVAITGISQPMVELKKQKRSPAILLLLSTQCGRNAGSGLIDILEFCLFVNDNLLLRIHGFMCFILFVWIMGSQRKKTQIHYLKG